MRIWNKVKKFLGIDNKNKENNMGKYQGEKGTLDYTKLNGAINKANKSYNDDNLNSVNSHLTNFKNNFEKLSEDKKQEELKGEKFQKISDNIKLLNNSKFNKILKDMEKQKKLSDFEKLSEQIEDIQKTLIRLEKEDIKEQGQNLSDIATSTDKIDEIATIIDNSFWKNIRNSIPKVEKIDLHSITQKIEFLKNDLKKNCNDINSSNQKLLNKIDNIKFPIPPTPQKIPTDYLKKDDFEFTINEKLKDLKEIKEISEDLESVPAKVISIEKEIKNISEKLDNLPSGNNTKISTHIPKEEKSVIDLAKYMTDGIAQFENIAKEYISKIDDLENLEKIKQNHKKELDSVEEKALNVGQEKGKVEIIKDIATKFPTEFQTIKSIFENQLQYKFEKDEILNITDENKNDKISFIENKIDIGKYKVIFPAILIENSILFKAKVEKENE